MVKRLMALGLLGVSGGVLAQGAVLDSPQWGGKIDFGFLSTSGNTNTETLNFAFDFGKDGLHWRHALHLDAYNNSSDEDRTAERYMGYWQSNQKFDDHHSMFYRAQYEEDKFSTYSEQATLSLGYGNRVLDGPTFLLDLEVGPGYRRSVLASNDDVINEAILRLAGNFKWVISESAEFGQSLSADSGSDNTVVRSTTSLSVTVYKALAVKLGYDLRWNREVTPDKDNWDRETSVGLLYTW